MPCKTKPYCPVYFKKECRQIQNTKFKGPFKKLFNQKRAMLLCQFDVAQNVQLP